MRPEMTARIDSLIAEGYSVLRFSELPTPFQLAIVRYMALEGDAWDGVDLSAYSSDYLESSLVELLPLFVDTYGSVQFGSVCLSAEAVAAAVMRDEEIADSHACWDDYHKWYLAGGDIPSHPAAERWPVILSTASCETIKDGWHRFHSYMRDGAVEIPAVFFPRKHHLAAKQTRQR